VSVLRRPLAVGLAVAVAALVGWSGAGRPAGGAIDPAQFLAEHVEIQLANDWAAARAQADRARQRFASAGDARGEAACWTLIGGTELALGGQEAGLAAFEQALGLLAGADPLGSAAVARLVARLDLGFGRYADAEERLRSALTAVERWNAAGSVIDREWFVIYHAFLELPAEWAAVGTEREKIAATAEAAVRLSLGEALLWRGRLAEAEATLQEALRRSQAGGGLLDAEGILYSGLVSQRRGERERAAARFDEAFARMAGGECRRPGGERERDLCFFVIERLADVAARAGRREEALAWIERGRAIFRRLDDPVREAGLLVEQAWALSTGGEIERAGAALGEALQLARDTSDPGVRGRLVSALALQALAQGKVELAASTLVRSSGMAPRAAGCDEVHKALIMAVSYLGLGARGSARDAAVNAAELIDSAHCPEGEWLAELLATALSEPGGESASAEVLTRLTEARGTPQLAHLEVDPRFVDALALLARGEEPARARRLLQAVVHSAVARRRPADEGRARLLLGLANARERREQAAREQWSTALSIFRRLGLKTEESLVLTESSELAWRAGDRAEAIRQAREAVDALEVSVGDIQVDDLVTSFLDQKATPYENLVEMLVESEEAGEAFAYAERARARALLRLLGGDRPRVDPGAHHALASEVEAQQVLLLELERKVRQARGETEAVELLRAAEAARREHEDLLLRLKLAGRGAVAPSDSLSVGEVQDVLPSDVTLLSFFVTPTRTLVWAVGRDRFDLVTIDLGRVELAQRVGRFRREIASRSTPEPAGARRGVRLVCPGSEPAERTAGDELFARLAVPLAPFLRTSRLLLVPHDSLHLLPFAALRDPDTGRYLVEDFELSYAPSASALRFLGERAGRWERRAVVLGDPALAPVEGLPGLHGARREAATVARLLGTAPHLGTEATEALLRERARGADIVHVAAHHVRSALGPRFDYLALSPDDRHDGKLEMREIHEELDLEGGRPHGALGLRDRGGGAHRRRRGRGLDPRFAQRRRGRRDGDALERGGRRLGGAGDGLLPAPVGGGAGGGGAGRGAARAACERENGGAVLLGGVHASRRAVAGQPVIPRKGLLLLALLLLAVLDRPAASTAQEPADLPCDPCDLAKAWPDLPPEARAELAPRLLSLLAAQSSAAGDRRAGAAFLALQGLATLSTDQIAEGQRLLEGSLAQLVELGETFGAGTVALVLGIDQAARGEPAKAEESLRRAIDSFAATREPLVVDTDGPDGIFFTLLDAPSGGSGLAWRPSARPELAAEAGEALARSILAEILAGQGRMGAAEAEYLHALKLTRPLGGSASHPEWIGLGEVFRAQGRSEDARRAFAEALAALDAGPAYESAQRTVEIRMRLLRTLSELNRTTGQLAEALEHSRVALELARQWSDRFAEVLALWERSESFRAARDDNRAEEALAEISALLPVIEVGEDRAKVLALLAVVAMREGRHEDALRLGNDAIAVSKRLGLREAEGMCRFLLASVYSTLFAHDRSNAELQRAAELVQDDDLQEWSRLLRLVNAAEVRGADALPEVMEALKTVEPGAEEETWLETFAGRLDQFAADTARLDQLASEARRSGGPLAGPAVIEALALADRMARDARQDALEGLEIARQNGNLQGQVSSLRMIALLEASRGRYEVALPFLREAVTLIEQGAQDLHVDDLVTPFLGAQAPAYEDLVTLLVKMGDGEEAFAYAERARAQALLRLLGNQRLSPARGADPGLLAEAETLRAQILGLEREVRAAANEDGAAAARRRADASRKDLEDLLLRLKLSSPEYAALTRVGPVRLDAVRAELSAGTTLVSFFVTDRHSHAWVMTRDGSEVLTLGVDRGRLAKLVERFRREIAAREETPPPGPERGARVLESDASATGGSAGEDLAQLLLAPLAPHLRTPHLLLLPHDSLHYLPFAALRNPATGRYLVEDFTLSYAPSASVLRLLDRRAGGFEGRVLVLGDPAVPAVEGLPPLAGARREAGAVARLFGTPARLGAGATETILRDHARGVDFLHVAAHNVPVPGDPRMSYLALTPDGRHDGKLEMREIFEELDLEQVDLVVLSACETALGERTGGDEIVGLTRALLYAGAASVMASLWSVDDDASAALMTAFYVRLLDGEPAAAALAAAQRELLDVEGTAAPFYWAAFTLVGNSSVDSRIR
jgi:CHAT domain-containing protein/tetratricopeptide (TPR) repeat protein